MIFRNGGKHGTAEHWHVFFSFSLIRAFLLLKIRNIIFFNRMKLDSIIYVTDSRIHNKLISTQKNWHERLSLKPIWLSTSSYIFTICRVRYSSIYTFTVPRKAGKLSKQELRLKMWHFVDSHSTQVNYFFKKFWNAITLVQKVALSNNCFYLLYFRMYLSALN